MKQINYTHKKKLLCDWTNKRKYILRYRISNFHVQRRMVVDKVHKISSFRQSKW